jgi:STE24 endopeptidase
VNEDKATRYQRSKRHTSAASIIWSVAYLAGLMATGLNIRLRAIAESAVQPLHGFWFVPASAVVFVGLLAIVNEGVALPLAFYGGFVLERRYGLSREGVGRWLLAQWKSLALGVVLSAGAAAIVYTLIEWSPGWWWLLAAAAFAALTVGLAQIAPVVILPIFYRVKPLERASLNARLVALAERAGARVLGVYEWGLGDRTKKANAALTGAGATRRILVSDTMLLEYSDEEIEVVLAHELGHHVHGDIWRGIALESALIVAGLYLASRAIEIWSRSIGLRGPADVAGLPLLILVAGTVSLLSAPAAHALSRAHERRADRFALDLTRNPAAFISAMRRLGAQNLAEEYPSRIVQWLFHSHPPLRERIAAARAFPASVDAPGSIVPSA